MTFFRGQLRLFPGVYTLGTKNKTKLSTFEMQESKILLKSDKRFSNDSQNSTTESSNISLVGLDKLCCLLLWCWVGVMTI